MYLTLSMVHSACPPLMGHTLWDFIFLGIIALCHSTCSSAISFLMLRSLRSFVIISLWMSSEETPRYHLIIYSFWPNIYIHSLEVNKVCKPVLLDLFMVTNYTKLFEEFLSSNMLFKSDTNDAANYTTVSRC